MAIWLNEGNELIKWSREEERKKTGERCRIHNKKSEIYEISFE